MGITAQDVKQLREMTGAGVMDCKKALLATDGDIDKAADKLREMGVVKAAKKAGRIASEGAVAAYCEGNVGALVEINCESDFVGKSDIFKKLCNDVAVQVVKTNPASVEDLLAQQSLAYEGTVLDYINSVTSTTGEKVSLRRFAREEVNGKIDTYIHMGGKIGVMLVVSTGADLSANEEFNATCHDISMHTAAFAPKYTYASEVPADEIAKEKEILHAQIMNDPARANKPAQIIEKMVEGGISKMYKEVCLAEQPYLKDQSVNVANIVAKLAKSVGTEVTIVKFVRFVMGEGLEKKNEDFAEEIAKLSGK